MLKGVCAFAMVHFSAVGLQSYKSITYLFILIRVYNLPMNVPTY